MQSRTALCSALALPLNGVPDWVHLLPAGEVRTIDGRGPYRAGDFATLMSASIPAGHKLPLDENHATDLAAPRGGPAPARGWIVELEERADGVWGRVEWTGEGRRIMEDKQYRGVSPVIAHRADGTITAIRRASLTNTPNLTGLVTLHSQQPGPTMNADDMEIIRKLGLDANAYAAERYPETPQDGLQAAEIAVCSKLGIDRAAFAATAYPQVPQDGLTKEDLDAIRLTGGDRALYVRNKAQEAS